MHINDAVGVVGSALVVARQGLCLFGRLGSGPPVEGHLRRRPLYIAQSRLGKRFCSTSVLVRAYGLHTTVTVFHDF